MINYVGKLGKIYGENLHSISIITEEIENITNYKSLMII
jgi:hypothetical protein